MELGRVPDRLPPGGAGPFEAFEFAAAGSGVSAETLAEVADVVAGAGHRFSCHSWRSAAAGNLGGWQVSRTLFLISALLGAVATPGGTFPNAWNKFVPRPVHVPPHPGVWQELTAASRELGITRQAVSARVKSAESQAGVALITWTPRGSALTPEGAVVAEGAAIAARYLGRRAPAAGRGGA